MIDYFLPLYENEYYHIYNRGNNGISIFYLEKNYGYFLEKFNQYLSRYIDVFAYCLLPNHFHFMVRIKQFNGLPLGAQVLKTGMRYLDKPEEVVSEQFRRFFLSYAKAIKLQEGRTGSLFEKNFKRIRVDSDNYFTTLVNYIHRNPETHRIIKEYKAYKYSSFKSMLSNKETNLRRKEVLDWFGDKEWLVQYHETNPVYKDYEHLIIE